ncbi:hypothetical protein Cantr_07086 [Candida viswanathii]|uniref:Protein FYV8 n=1 Tax=Candida viswanathii TaxID=5486 RepID=A0A367Y1K6_9ASCO|nr:hypothetical protein Cantr_07086 [Candida viswanathii]
MTDRFGRQKSQRWVNSVPTYGDWGDDEYGYDEDEAYDYQGDDHEQQPHEQQKKLTPQRFELPSDHVPPLPTVDIQDYQDQSHDTNTATAATAPPPAQAPHFEQPPSNLVLSTDKDRQVGTSDSEDEIQPIQLNRNSFYDPETNDTDEPAYSAESPHPLSSLGQPGLRLSIYRKDIKSEEQVFDGIADDYQDDADSIGDDAEFRSVNPSPDTRTLQTNGVNNTHGEAPAPPPPPPNLVLSVDKQNGVYSESSDDDMNYSDDVRSEVGFNETVDKFQKSSSKSTSNTPTIDTRSTKQAFQETEVPHQSFEPPTPTYSYSHQGSAPPESPSVASETSFNSEYSYQKEPTSLRLATHQEAGELQEREQEQVHPVATNKLEPIETVTKLEPPQQQQPGLVLSVDKQKLDDSGDDEDDWGYHSQNSSNDEEVEGGLNNPRDPHADIDSFINELNSSSQGERSGDKSGEILPPLDHDVSLPDFENTSFSKYDEEKHEQPLNNGHHAEDDDDDGDFAFPIKPLSISQQKEAHDDYLSSLSGRRQSVRKPPRQSMVFSDDFEGIVGGYANSIQENEQEETLQVHDDGVQIKEPSDNGSRKDSFDLAPPELHPVLSSGSLSTGKFSMDTNSQRLSMDVGSQRLSMDTTSQRPIDGADEFLPRDVRDSRRISTLSNATFNLGGWTPNTDRFRNQFINDNDSESINYNPEKSTYDNFSKVRTTGSSGLAEEISNSSSLSVPETIDAGMPSIQEDPTSDDEHDTSNNDNEGSEKVEEFHGDSQSINPAYTMSSFNDSVLADHIYQKPLFREERLTPAASKDDLLPQKYQSLIPPDARKASDSSETTERNRSTSTSTVKTDATVHVLPKISSPPATITPGKYPVSDWKSIVTISQPCDRITAFKQALLREQEYDSGIKTWLNYALKQEPTMNSHLLIGRVASQAYQNAPHNDLRRHASLRTKVNLVKDKVEGTTGSLGKTTGSFGKKLFNRSKKFIKSTTGDK